MIEPLDFAKGFPFIVENHELGVVLLIPLLLINSVVLRVLVQLQHRVLG
jgi:hypothetical protein